MTVRSRDAQDAVRDCAAVMRALGHHRRLEILVALFDGPMSVSDLVRGLGLDQPAVSRHLGALRRAGLVEARRDAQWVIYMLSARVGGPVPGTPGTIDLGCCQVRFASARPPPARDD